MDHKRERQGVSVGTSTRFRSGAGQTTLDLWTSEKRNEHVQGHDGGDLAEVPGGAEILQVHRTIPGERQGLLLEGHSERCRRLSGFSNGYPCYGCRGAVEPGACERIRGIKSA